MSAGPGAGEGSVAGGGDGVARGGGPGEGAPLPDEAARSFRSGFVAVLGRPNVGKSTLVNAFLGKALCITSFKPQTTRYQIRCIVTDPGRQIVFVDTPGFVTSERPIDKMMRREIQRGSDAVDVAMFVLDSTHLSLPETERAYQLIASHLSAAKIVVLNKIDRRSKVELIPQLEEIQARLSPDELVPVSALTGQNLAELDRVVTARLPEGPALYPGDVLTDKPPAFIYSEFVREQLYGLTREEVPFACAVSVETLQETEAELEMEAVILVEKDSLKGIVIGAGGSKIKEIRERSRRRLKAFTHKKVTLALRVKVDREWRASARRLAELGRGE